MSLKRKIQYVYTISSAVVALCTCAWNITFHKRNEYADRYNWTIMIKL